MWVRGGLSTPAREFPEFPAVLSTLYGVAGPADLRSLLELRVEALKARLAGLETPYPGVPRLFLLEEEHMAAVVRAEIKWLRGVMADLRARRLTFPSDRVIRRMSSNTAPPVGEPAAGRSRRASAGR